MTKVYLGGDRYEVYFNSGTMVIMTKEDIDELVDESDNVSELVEDNKALQKLSDDILGDIEDQGAIIRELDEAISEVTRTPQRKKLQAISEELDTLSKYI